MNMDTMCSMGGPMMKGMIGQRMVMMQMMQHEQVREVAP